MNVEQYHVDEGVERAPCSSIDHDSRLANRDAHFILHVGSADHFYCREHLLQELAANPYQLAKFVVNASFPENQETDVDELHRS